MPTEKKPQDRNAKTPPVDRVTANSGDGTITMRIAGESFVSVPLHEVFTGGWFRRNRHLDELDGFYTMIEDAFAGVDGFFDAWDALSLPAQQVLHGEMQKAMQVSVGESTRSST